MKTSLLLLTLTLALAGCQLEDETLALEANAKEEQVWTFIQFNVPEEDEGLESFYYYGKVSKSLYQLISSNRLQSGFLRLQDMHYWGDDDLIYTYRDPQNSGEMVFRIEDIRSMKLVRKAPTPGLGYEQFEEPQNKGIKPAAATLEQRS
ncbi:hypothetical protein LRS11_16155 [Pseudomonas sp. J452]|uniref:hypothetical protein n=1 Tax=Pseudomonas sp. J452 TaxID=2898441 RepID=UPI0021ADB4EE|nr:hypothetical protein [Pseudomonas sp. J452]UUY07346.1 hypothetical protein LRS11_16155 [Pseudomonas sp. J452]